jgi:hypothetical protein
MVVVAEVTVQVIHNPCDNGGEISKPHLFDDKNECPAITPAVFAQIALSSGRNVYVPVPESGCPSPIKGRTAVVEV